MLRDIMSQLQQEFLQSYNPVYPYDVATCKVADQFPVGIALRWLGAGCLDRRERKVGPTTQPPFPRYLFRKKVQCHLSLLSV